MKIKTKELQNKVAILSTVIGNNVALPITCLVGIKSESNKLKMSVVGNNSVEVDIDAENVDPNLNFSIRSDIFLKIVPKFTCEDLELIIDNGNVLIKTIYGDYRFPKQTGPDGDVTFDDIVVDGTNIGSLVSDDVSIANSKISYALGVPGTNKDIENYHFYSDKVVTGNGAVIAKIEKTINLTKGLSISAETIKTLLSIFNKVEDKVDVFESGDFVYYVCGNIKFKTKKNDIDTFPIDAINSYFTKSYENNINLNRQEILDSLERISIFASNMVNVNDVHISCKMDVMTLNIGKDVEEKISYRGKTPKNPFECNINLQGLKNTLANTGEAELIDISCDTTKNLVASANNSNIYNVISYSVPTQG